MNKSRYPGARPFDFSEKGIFFGRERALNSLQQLVELEQIVVLYGRSGIGKSSLVNAGLIPRLNEKGECDSILVRFGSYISVQDQSPIERLKIQIPLKGNINNELLSLPLKDDTLWFFIKNWQIQNEQKQLLIIIDQFEELFTYSEEDIREFQVQLSKVLYNLIPEDLQQIVEEHFDNRNIEKKHIEILDKVLHPLQLKVLLLIRSDRISNLDALSDSFPSITRNMFGLEALDMEEAREAIIAPTLVDDLKFSSPRFQYSNEALTEMIAFLSGNHKERIESFQLQILCQSIERKVINKGLSNIEPKDIGSIESLLENYYEDIIASLGSEEDQLAARRLIEEGLIFEKEERRLSLYEGQITTLFNVSHSLLDRLVDSHLLRGEPSLMGGYTYELSHDTLISSVLRAKQERLTAEKQERTLTEFQRDNEQEIAFQTQIEKQKRIIRTLFILLILTYLIVFFFLILLLD